MPRHSAVVTCSRVTAGDPVLYVSRDDAGDWSFLCGADHDDEALAESAEEMKLVCAECTVAGDPTLNEVAKLRCGESAERSAVGGEWVVDDGMEAFRARVQQHGWMVMGIDDDAPFSYTVGLWEHFQHPELIVMGLRAQSAHRLLNACGEHIKQHGALSLEVPTEGVLEGYPVRVREVKERESKVEHIGYALWYYKEPVPLLQVLWPSQERVFPDEPDAPDDFKALQPLLP
jgi:hypothetical protein